MTIRPDEILDTKGLCCPMPAVKTSLKLEHMQKGQVVEVLTTDLASRKDLPAWAKSTGNQCLQIDTDKEGITHIFIKKS